ncbi:MAG TPA: VWA domain-containing protein [Polyangia bacterium]|nr:VWA domain-containing protein [Polyangia bacterium]
MTGLALVSTLIASSGCVVWLQEVPHTPRLENLNSQQVLSMVPPIPWTQIQPDDPARAPIELQCGIGPSIGTADLYAAVVVRGRPPAGNVAPLNVSLLIDRSRHISGGVFGEMLGAAQAFVAQLRDGDRLSVIAFSDGVYEPLPPMVIAPNTRPTAFAAIQSLQQYGKGNLEGGLLAGLVEVFSAFQPWQVNQLVVFTNGRPEKGMTQFSDLTQLAALSADHGVGVTTVGFGYEHNELLLLGLADASGGNYYYVDNPGAIGQLFQGDANALLSGVARAVDVDLTVPAGGVLEDVFGYDYLKTADAHTWVRVGSVQRNDDRYAVFKFKPGNGGPLPVSVVYSDVTRQGRFSLSCAPNHDPHAGGADRWALELAGRGEAASGLETAMALSDAGNDLGFAKQIGETRGIIGGMRNVLGAQALMAEDQMLLGAQVELGLQLAEGASNALSSGGVRGLLSFGAQTVAKNVMAAAFQPGVRAGEQVTFEGMTATRYSVRNTPVKERDEKAGPKFKRARYRSYEMMRHRGR